MLRVRVKRSACKLDMPVMTPLSSFRGTHMSTWLHDLVVPSMSFGVRGRQVAFEVVIWRPDRQSLGAAIGIGADI